MEMFYTILTLAIYGGGMTWLTYRFVKKRQDAEYYNVADRKNGAVQSALSIAATWIWAPALFAASTQAYNNGWVGLFWFLVPNILTLFLMIPFAKRLRAKYPNGFTLSGFMRKRYGKSVQRLYQAEMGTLSTLSIAVNLLAGSTVITMISGIPFWVASLTLAVIVLGYTYKHGIKSSLLSDAVQMVLILGVLGVFTAFGLSGSGWGNMAAGIQGINGIDGLFTSSGIGVALTFGIISAIGLFAGPMGDQSFWQRVFATEPKKITKAFGLGAVFFGLVPLMMSIFGFIAVGSKAEVANPGYVNLEVIQAIFPAWVTVPFLIMLLSGLLSTVDSQMLALSSLATDYTKDLNKQRGVMITGLIIAILIANIPGNSVLFMFLVYGTLRASTLLITMLTLGGANLRTRSVATGIAISMGIGFPLFIWGNLANLNDVKLWGSIATVLTSGIVAVVGSAIERRNEPDHAPVEEFVA